MMNILQMLWTLLFPKIFYNFELTVFAEKSTDQPKEFVLRALSASTEKSQIDEQLHLISVDMLIEIIKNQWKKTIFSTYSGQSTCHFASSLF